MIGPVAVLLAAQMIQPVSSSLPRYDIERTCRAALSAMTGILTDTKACSGDEQTARETLLKTWHNFAAAERTRCAETARLSPEPSYVELLTCLEMARDVKTSRTKSGNAATSGAGTAATGAQAVDER
jgi:hypothetical protein